MKTLLLLRHGKSSWKDSTLSDDQRPLKKRGRRAATRMGEEIQNRNLSPGVIVSSKAKRARQTAQRVLDQLDPQCPLVVRSELYFEGSRSYLQVAAQEGGEHESILLVGHNPDLEELVARLTDQDLFLPTACLVRIDLETESWSEIENLSGTLQFVLKPREL